MGDPRDFIDFDEGYRREDWESKPFYTEALPCESCGRPVAESDLKQATWDESLRVGPCCEFSFDIPELANAPICENLWTALYRCRSVAEVSLRMSVHIAECPTCQSRCPAPAKATEPVEMPDGEWIFPNRRKAA